MAELNNEIEFKDGAYNIGVELSGGNGTEEIQSPTSFEIKDGKMTATVIWKDSDVDYMMIDGIEYAPVKDNGNPTFKITVSDLDKDIDVYTETITGTQSKRDEYALNFKGDTMTKMHGSFLSSEIITILLVLVFVGVAERIIKGIFGKKNKDLYNGVIESTASEIDEEDID